MRFPWQRIWQNPGELLLPGLQDMATRALLYRRPAEPATLLVKHGSQVFAIRLRRHRRARRYTLRIHPTDREAILTMPPRGTLMEAKDFAQLHGGWIAARLGRLPKAAPFQAGTVVPLRGVPHRIVHRAGARGTVWTETRDSGEKILCVAGGFEHMDRRVHDFLKREARKDLHKASLAYAADLGVRVRRVSIRDQSSRWGSCTSAGSATMSNAPSAGSTPTATTCIDTGSRIRSFCRPLRTRGRITTAARFTKTTNPVAAAHGCGVARRDHGAGTTDWFSGVRHLR